MRDQFRKRFLFRSKVIINYYDSFRQVISLSENYYQDSIRRSFEKFRLVHRVISHNSTMIMEERFNW